MKRFSILLVLLPCLLCACATMEPANLYERDELVAVQHSQQTDCTLLIYRDPMGQTHHVFRRHGIFEFVLTFTSDGGFALRERGAAPRVIEAAEAHRVTKHIHERLQAQEEEGGEQLSSI